MGTFLGTLDNYKFKRRSNFLFTNKYFKYTEKLLKLKISNEIQDTIKRYLSLYDIYGIGKNRNVQLGLDNAQKLRLCFKKHLI